MFMQVEVLFIKEEKNLVRVRMFLSRFGNTRAFIKEKKKQNFMIFFLNRKLKKKNILKKDEISLRAK